MPINEAVSPFLQALVQGSANRLAGQEQRRNLRAQSLRDLWLRRQQREQSIADALTDFKQRQEVEATRAENERASKEYEVQNRVPDRNPYGEEAVKYWQKTTGSRPIGGERQPRGINYPSQSDIEAEMETLPGVSGWRQQIDDLKPPIWDARYSENKNPSVAESLAQLRERLQASIDSARGEVRGRQLLGLNPGMKFQEPQQGNPPPQEDIGGWIDTLTESWKNGDIDDDEYERRLNELVMSNKLTLEGYQALSPFQ